jgi:hypothetical protein
VYQRRVQQGTGNAFFFFFFFFNGIKEHQHQLARPW